MRASSSRRPWKACIDVHPVEPHRGPVPLHQLGAEERARLERPGEAAPALASAGGEGGQLAALPREQRHQPVRLAVVQRAQDERLVRPAFHSGFGLQGVRARLRPPSRSRSGVHSSRTLACAARWRSPRRRRSSPGPRSRGPGAPGSCPGSWCASATFGAGLDELGRTRCSAAFSSSRASWTSPRSL